MGLGGNPYGPAGTGKTESVKALGGLFGRQVLVFNCDEVSVHLCIATLYTVNVHMYNNVHTIATYIHCIQSMHNNVHTGN